MGTVMWLPVFAEEIRQMVPYYEGGSDVLGRSESFMIRGSMVGSRRPDRLSNRLTMNAVKESGHPYRKAFTLVMAALGLLLIAGTVVSLLSDALSYPNSWKVLLDPVIIAMLVVSPFLYAFIAKPLREMAERQKRMNEVLEGERKNLKAIFEATPVGMMLIDQTLTVQKVNRAMGEIMARDVGEMIYKQFGEALGWTDKTITLSAHDLGSDGQIRSLQNVVLGPIEKGEPVYGLEIPFVVDDAAHQHKKWIHVCAVPTTVLGQRNALLLVEDITRRRENERKIKEAKEQAEKARQDLEIANKKLEEAAEYATMLADEAIAANVAKSQFLSNMSHEIRTPMNTIVGFGDVLMEEELSAEQHGYVKVIQRSADHLLSLINDILDFSKMEANKLIMENIACSLQEMLDDLESAFLTQANDKQLDFHIVQTKDLPDTIYTDPTRLRQCLFNLISNALKFTEQGHVHVNVSLEIAHETHYIRIDISDTGIGIPEEKQKLIFEAFTQADAHTTRKYGGTGLGLAITKRLIQLLGGDLFVKSQPNQGSTFSLIVPIESRLSGQNASAPLESITEDTHKQHPEAMASDGFKGRVLVAEDSPGNRCLIQTLFNDIAIDLTVVNDGREAVEHALNHSYDLILMDMQMPNLSGYDATETLRKQGIITPIIAVTANAMEGDRDQCLAVGCTDYMAKPIHRHSFLTLLQHYLNPKHDAEQADPNTSTLTQEETSPI